MTDVVPSWLPSKGTKEPPSNVSASPHGGLSLSLSLSPPLSLDRVRGPGERSNNGPHGVLDAWPREPVSQRHDSQGEGLLIQRPVGRGKQSSVSPSPLLPSKPRPFCSVSPTDDVPSPRAQPLFSSLAFLGNPTRCLAGPERGTLELHTYVHPDER